MAPNPLNLAADLRGLSGLTIDAISGVVDIVEALHQAISSSAGIISVPERTRTRGITGLVYRNIRLITGLVGGGLDAVLKPLEALSDERDPSPGREALLAALNGLLGDHLLARDNPLAIPMQFRQQGRPLAGWALEDYIQQANGRLVILVHGAFLNDYSWGRSGHDHGAALARDLGFAPLYLHYNTGLHISQNGREFAAKLQSIAAQTPQPLALIIIGHSMGGLVARSAAHYAQLAGHTWLKALRKIVFLGTPHHGSPLERGGNWLNTILDASPYSAPFARMGKMRSAGITDLRFGSLVDEDWRGRERFGPCWDQRLPVPLPPGVPCYAVAAAGSENPGRRFDDQRGDGLVPISSALGHHQQAALNLAIPQARQWIGRPMKHMDLLDHPAVYETIKRWMFER